MSQNDEAIERDIKVLREFAGIYCRQKHGIAGELCTQCRDVLDYAIERRRKCPFAPKPTCKDCTVHCFGEPYRSQIREVMKMAGMHYLKHGRVDKIVKLAIGKVRGTRKKN